ncbi:MAG: HEPN domain-containing protein [Methanobrevibacter sp.]|jgi:uncharacterized protein (UPF0332 family)|nr:HEPN domain-containing protein [Candidatus Methanoflexus mossambicus]
MDKINVVFKRAIESLKVSELNFENEFYSASINRSYYACFYMAKALLLKKGFNPKTHRGTIRQFGLEYVEKGNFDKHIAKFFSILEEDREDADYDFSYDSTRQIAQNDLNNAKLFIEESKKFL